LPNPELNNVVYFGEYDRTLFKSLKQFSHRFSIVPTTDNNSHWDEGKQKFDLGVLKSCKIEYIKKIETFLVNGGYLYWEINRNFSLKSKIIETNNQAAKNDLLSDFHKDNFRRINFFVSYLYESGFSNISVQWHRPSFDSCLEIIPLINSSALDHFLSKTQYQIKDKLKYSLVRFLSKVELLDYFIKNFSIIAQKDF